MPIKIRLLKEVNEIVEFCGSDAQIIAKKTFF